MRSETPGFSSIIWWYSDSTPQTQHPARLRHSAASSQEPLRPTSLRPSRPATNRAFLKQRESV